MRRTTVTNMATTHPIAFLHISKEKPRRRERHKPPASTVHHQRSKNHVVESYKLLGSHPSLLSCSKPAISTLHSHSKYLEQENAAILKKIIEMEDRSMKNASQQLQQYDKAESNIHAVQAWTDRQIQDAHRDLEAAREQREKRVMALRLQLQACEEKIKAAQEDLYRLREYRDREHSVKVLEAAELERQLRVLNEAHQDQATDVEALAHTEIQKLLESQQTVKDATLQNVVEMVADIQNEVLDLLEKGDSLRKSWKGETDRLCRDLLLGKPICTPDEDVVLNIPLNQQMPI
ncbi:uncharacterized protein C20orf96 homolog isoform X2 [Mixophyes fleayi]|uniref:uncharacterized protein C20orf96 homolog isoform X2 n=1 Tax=Mixophyes fleayi TaxID=3061075 RepID=UPI003F4DE306